MGARLNLFSLLSLLFLLSAGPSLGQTHVFERYAVPDAALVPDVVNQIERALSENGYDVLVVYEPGRPDECTYDSRLIVATHANDEEELVKANPETGAFFSATSIIVFEDPSGIQIGLANPRSILRTILMDDPAADELAAARQGRLEAALGQVPVVVDNSVSYGQRRKNGHIGKTMGVMAGGPFDSKIDVMSVTDMAPEEAARVLESAFGTPEGQWNLDVLYVVELPNDAGFVLGVSGAPMEKKSFEIVGAGADKARSGYPCAGIAHAAAYPIELHLAPTETGTEIRLVAAMYRMKLYFEDAGKWAFMKNMGMPGSIADEITSRVDWALQSSGGGSN